MTCEMTDREQHLDDFLLRKLSEREAEAFEIHVFGCADCLRELRMREQMIALLQEEQAAIAAATPRAKPHRSFMETIHDFFSVRPNAWIYAGAAAALLVALVALPLFRSEDAVPDYAANFTEALHLESKAGQPFRSSTLSVEVSSPAHEQNFTRHIPFRWEIKKAGVPLRETVILKVIDHAEQVIQNVETSDGRYDLKQELAPGVYYWSLEHQNQTLYLGKFFFKRPKP